MHKLGWGYQEGLPDGTTAAWGARLIFPDDLLWDRTDSVGDEAPRQELLGYLRDTVKDAPFDEARRLSDRGELLARERKEVTLYADGTCTVLANPKASGGYLYIVAFLNAHVPEIDKSAVFIDKVIRIVQHPTDREDAKIAQLDALIEDTFGSDLG